MTLDTQMTLALLQELLMALRANDADGLAAGREFLAHMGSKKAVITNRLRDAARRRGV